ncbi:hypothetical protein BDZ97DRAFT_1388808 [Flammula alnicola]|nr:hypothetical protein BDZ97DRAFT_1388808 [Flammula alnicola]
MPAGTTAEVWIADLPPYGTAVYYSSPPDPNPFASSSWSPPIGVGSPESMSPGTLSRHSYDEGRRYEQILWPRRPGAKRHRVSGYESDVDKPPRGIRAYRTPPPQSHVVGDPRPQSRNRKPTVVDQREPSNPFNPSKQRREPTVSVRSELQNPHNHRRELPIIIHPSNQRPELPPIIIRPNKEPSEQPPIIIRPPNERFNLPLIVNPPKDHPSQLAPVIVHPSNGRSEPPIIIKPSQGPAKPSVVMNSQATSAPHKKRVANKLHTSGPPNLTINPSTSTSTEIGLDGNVTPLAPNPRTRLSSASPLSDPSAGPSNSNSSPGTSSRHEFGIQNVNRDRGVPILAFATSEKSWASSSVSESSSIRTIRKTDYVFPPQRASKFNDERIGVRREYIIRHSFSTIVDNILFLCRPIRVLVRRLN